MAADLTAGWLPDFPAGLAAGLELDLLEDGFERDGEERVLLEDLERVLEPERLLPFELDRVAVRERVPELEPEPDFLLPDFLRFGLEAGLAGRAGAGAAARATGLEGAGTSPPPWARCCDAVLTPASPPAEMAWSESSVAEFQARPTAAAGPTRF